MKKEFNKIVIFIGFIVCVVGLLLTPLMSFTAIDLTSFAIIPLLAATFIFANNSVVKNVGYGLCAITITNALNCLFFAENTGIAIVGIGLVVMFFGSLVYFLTLILTFFGFVKGECKNKCAHSSDLLSALEKYKNLVAEKVLSEEEFVELKKNLLSSSPKQATSIDDLKKWKKAVEQSLITEEEYQNIKSSILTK